jgi:hypothetical protein
MEKTKLNACNPCGKFRAVSRETFPSYQFKNKYKIRYNKVRQWQGLCRSWNQDRPTRITISNKENKKSSKQAQKHPFYCMLLTSWTKTAALQTTNNGECFISSLSTNHNQWKLEESPGSGSESHKHSMKNSCHPYWQCPNESPWYILLWFIKYWTSFRFS